jgi:hypothetical protein
MIAGVAIIRLFQGIKKNRDEKVNVVKEVNLFFNQSMLTVIFYLFITLFINIFG